MLVLSLIEYYVSSVYTSIVFYNIYYITMLASDYVAVDVDSVSAVSDFTSSDDFTTAINL